MDNTNFAAKEADFLAKKLMAKNDIAKMDERSYRELLKSVLLSDLSLWEELDQKYGGEVPTIHQDHIRACELHRKQGTSFSGYLGILRRRHALSINDCAERLGIAEHTWFEWEEGVQTPRVRQLQSVQAVLGFEEIEAKRLSELLEQKIEDLSIGELPPDDEDWEDLDFKIFGTRDSEQIKRQLQGFSESCGEKETFGRFLKLRRKLKRLSVEEMAERASVSPSRWRNWENNDNLPSLRETEAIAHRLFVVRSARRELLERRKRAS